MITNAILVVDDNRAVRETLTDVFTCLLDVPVYTAADSQEGLQLFQQQWQSIALVLLGMNMPVLNGEQVYEKLRQIDPQVKVIISSNLGQAEASHRLGQPEMPTFLRQLNVNPPQPKIRPAIKRQVMAETER